MQKDILALMNSISRRTVEYLSDDAGLEAERIEFNLKSVNQLTLKSLTSLVALSGGINFYLAFSFDEPVIDKILEAYTSDIEIDEEQIDMFKEVTAGDLINLVTGNALHEVAEEGTPITITPPLFINEAKQIGRADSANIYMASIHFPEGGMDILCIGPPKLFDEALNCKETQ